MKIFAHMYSHPASDPGSPNSHPLGDVYFHQHNTGLVLFFSHQLIENLEIIMKTKKRFKYVFCRSDEVIH